MSKIKEAQQAHIREMWFNGALQLRGEPTSYHSVTFYEGARTVLELAKKNADYSVYVGTVAPGEGQYISIDKLEEFFK